MKTKYQHILKIATGLILLLIVSNNAIAQVTVQTSSTTKVKVGIVESVDRFVTLTSGQKIYTGADISFLLGQTLFNSSSFAPFMVSAPVTNAVTINAATSAERLAQIPGDWITWIARNSNALAQVQTYPPVVGQVDVLITPQVEALVYASGARSNRVTYGFSPNHVNAFNVGEAGYLDNGYVASRDQLNQCAKPDFFNGTFNPASSFAPSQSNYGADMDEGFIFSLFGYEIGYKNKKYTVGSQVRFLIDDLRSGNHKEFVYKITANGTDKIVVFGLHGVSLSLEIQRAQTLSNALKAMLPQIVNQLVAESFMQALPSPSISALGLGSGANSIAALSLTEKITESAITLPNTTPSSTPVAQQQLTACYDQKSNIFTSWLASLFEFYGMWRYNHVLDQPFKGHSNLTVNSSVLKIGMIDSGIDYNDSTLQNYVIPDATNSQQVLGFDFISWDNRPSDDNGHGSAAAKLLVQTAHVPFAIIPIKVIGPFAQTQSGAIYDSFNYALINKLDAVVVPWISSASTLKAIEEGAVLLAQNGIPVFVEMNAIDSAILNKYATIYSPKLNSSSDFQTKAIGNTTVKLDSAGVATIQQLAAWMNAGGSHASQ